MKKGIHIAFLAGRRWWTSLLRPAPNDVDPLRLLAPASRRLASELVVLNSTGATLSFPFPVANPSLSQVLAPNLADRSPLLSAALVLVSRAGLLVGSLSLCKQQKMDEPGAGDSEWPRAARRRWGNPARGSPLRR